MASAQARARDEIERATSKPFYVRQYGSAAQMFVYDSKSGIQFAKW